MINNSINEAYEEGYDAYFTSKNKKDNPYRKNTDNNTEWNDGRNQAEKNDT